MAVSFGAGIFFGFYTEVSGLAVFVSACILIVFLILKHVNHSDKTLVCSVSALNFLRGTKPNLQNMLCLALVFFLSGAFCFFIHVDKKDPMLSFVDGYITIEGTVLDVQKRDTDRYRLVVKTSGEKSKLLINIYGDIGIENYGDIAGRRVQISGKVELPSERRNPKTFDYRLFLQTKGIHVLMNIAPYDMTVMDGDVKILTNILSNIRYNYIYNIIKIMNEKNAGILIGMLFGDKNLLDDDIYEMFQKNGTAHILAVSGLHVGVVYIFLNR